MSEEHLVYRKILRATTIFGGVQGITIISSLVKSKFLAILIGTSGYGIYGVLNTIVDLIKQVSGLGIETSGVKFLADLDENADKSDYQRNSSLILKLSFLLGFIGMLIAIIFSPFLSFLVYKQMSKWYIFIFISIAILFKQLVSSNNAIFQGSDKLLFLAKSNLYSNLVGLIFTLPLFYFFKTDAIVLSIVIISLINFVISYFYIKKLNLVQHKIKILQSFYEGREMLRFGSLFVIMSFLPLLVNFLIQLIINYKDGLHVVGLFNVSIVVLNTYVGFVFSIMSTEYYPRLIKAIKSNSIISKTVSQQIIVSILLVVPVIVFFIAFGNLIIKILFSEKFVEIIAMLNWAMLGMFFKSISFSIGYIFIAQADSKIFTKTSIIFNTLYFVLLYFGYQFRGLEGLGIAISSYYFFHLLTIYIIAKRRYFLEIDKDVVIIAFSGFTFCILALLFKLLIRNNFYYLLVLFLIASSLSIYKLSKLISINDFFKRKNNDKAI